MRQGKKRTPSGENSVTRYSIPHLALPDTNTGLTHLLLHSETGS